MAHETMTIESPAPCLLELRFRCVAPIGGLLHFHGPQWSALFRNILGSRLPGGGGLAAAGVSVQPWETGVSAYAPDDAIHVGLTFPATLLPQIGQLLVDFNDLSTGDGQFAPGRTIRLEGVRCRITGEELPPGDVAAKAGIITSEIIAAEIEALAALDTFRIIFPVPLRLTRPARMKTPGHRYGDEDFFLGDPTGAAAALEHLIAKIRPSGMMSSDTGRRTQPGTDDVVKESIATEISRVVTANGHSKTVSSLTIAGGALVWLDLPYLNRGEGVTKTIGGVVGTLRITGRPNPATASRLVWGQYLGAGKNPAFGLGFYCIPELDDSRRIAAPTRGKTLLNRFISEATLDTALRHGTDSSPGPDGLSFADLKKGGPPLLEHLAQLVRDGGYVPAAAKTYRMPKTNGGFREIRIQNVVDRLVQKAAVDHLAPVVDRFLSNASFAYRAGLNRKGAAEALKAALAAGYQRGIKADIAAFFDSVDLSRLGNLLVGLLPFDPLPGHILSWLSAANGPQGNGLPQGSPLSPVLSNLFLQRFDRDMELAGFRLIRYADDFVVLFRDEDDEDGMSRVAASLSKLGLTLQADKTYPVLPDRPIHFLGYTITRDEITDEEKPPADDTEPWLPVFREEWTTGTPVYLSSICRGAYSSGPNLVIKDERDRTQNIPWNRISRLVVVGRSPFSGGVVYRAVRENIPVSFIDVMGHAVGRLHPSGYEIPEMAALQEEKAKDDTFCLEFAREIITAKIINSAVLLRRNGIDAADVRQMAERAKQAENLDSLRGYEGSAARMYFAHIAALVAPLPFKGRTYHPPDGPVNILLSFGYTLLYNRLAAVLKDRGFNPRVGFFHQGRGGHLALASDLLEELRHVAERIVLALVHLGEIKAEDFTTSERHGTSSCRMEGEGFRKFIRRYETTMAAPFGGRDGEKTTGNAYLDEMADRMKRYLKLGIPYQALRIR